MALPQKPRVRPPIIHTGLQLGVRRPDKLGNRFNGINIVDASRICPMPQLPSPFGRGLGEGLTLEALLRDLKRDDFAQGAKSSLLNIQVLDRLPKPSSPTLIPEGRGRTEIRIRQRNSWAGLNILIREVCHYPFNGFSVRQLMSLRRVQRLHRFDQRAKPLKRFRVLLLPFITGLKPGVNERPDFQTFEARLHPLPS